MNHLYVCPFSMIQQPSTADALRHPPEGSQSRHAANGAVDAGCPSNSHVRNEGGCSPQLYTIIYTIEIQATFQKIVYKYCEWILISEV